MLGKIRFFAATLLVLLSLGHLVSATVGFKPAQSYAVGTAPEMAALADFNNDGKPDIAVVCYGDPSVGDDGGVSILLGNGDGTFQPATKLTAGKKPTRIATGDFNSDGKSDLLVVRAGDANVGDNGDATIFLGNGDGTFSPGQVLAPGKNPSAVAVSDLNGDHRTDLIFANSTDNSVAILLGNGDGTFQSPVAYAVAAGGSPFSISVADVNQDGRSDLAVFWGGRVDFFFGNHVHAFADVGNEISHHVAGPLNFKLDGHLRLDRVAGRTGPLPTLDQNAQQERAAKAKALATKYRNEIIEP